MRHGSSSKCSVVVIDDNADTAELLVRLLAALGCEATCVTDPRDALAEVSHVRPHIVFLDIGMPQVDGYQVAEKLRNVYGRDEIKIVAVTGYGTSEDRRRTRKAGFDAHVTKPVDPYMLDSILKTLLPTG